MVVDEGEDSESGGDGGFKNLEVCIQRIEKMGIGLEM